MKDHPNINHKKIHHAKNQKMAITYIILAHDAPEQLEALVRRLNHANIFFYIHIDLNVEIYDFKKNLRMPNVFFIEDRLRCAWGDFSIVEATLNCIRKIIGDNREGHTVLLSGQDYPINNNYSIINFFNNNKSTNFISCAPIKKVWPNRYIYRIQSHKINFSFEKNDFIYLPTIFTLRPKGIIRNLKKLIIKSWKDKKISHLKYATYIFLYKKNPGKIDFYGGHQWWALPNETLSKIITYIDNNESFYNFFKGALIPDELFFQTAIMTLIKNGAKMEIKENITYTKWLSSDENSPEILTSEDIDNIVSSSKSKMFARKFCFKVDSEIINLINEKLINAKNSL